MYITLEQVEKAQKTLDFLEANPHLWSQHIWLRSTDNTTNENGDQLSENHKSPDNPLVLSEALSCGTAGCFAGWYAMHQSQGVYFDGGHTKFPYVLVNGEWLELEEWVAQDLGLIGTESPDGLSSVMFEEDNSMDTLREWVAAMRESYQTGTDLTTIVSERELV